MFALGTTEGFCLAVPPARLITAERNGYFRFASYSASDIKSGGEEEEIGVRYVGFPVVPSGLMARSGFVCHGLTPMATA